MVTRTGAQRVPGHLGIHVRMTVDEARCHHLTLRFDDLARTLARKPPDVHNSPMLHTHIGSVSRHARTVHHGTVFYQQVETHRCPPSAKFQFKRPIVPES